eukprot:4365051-Lingulodinium_polyedra.AAC.1
MAATTLVKIARRCRYLPLVVIANSAMLSDEYRPQIRNCHCALSANNTATTRHSPTMRSTANV